MSISDCPAQIVCELTDTVGGVVTVTVPDPVLLQPGNEQVTVQFVVNAGFTVIVCVVCPPGDHRQVPPLVDGVAVSVVDCPVQIVCEFTVTVGAVVTVTVPDPVLLQPGNEQVTVQFVVNAGFTVIDCVVAPPGDHRYVPPAVDGVAVSVADCPAQIVCEFTSTVGAVVTVTVPDPLLLQPDKE